MLKRAKDVVKAHKVLNGVDLRETPLDYDHYLSEKYGAKVYQKENAQRVRSFKIRGAYYAVSQLTKNVSAELSVRRRKSRSRCCLHL